MNNIMMNRIIEREKCNGCEACQESCPKKAIRMQRDLNGFYYPVIEEDKCIDCGICGNICPVQNKVEFRKNDIKYNDTLAYGGYNADPSILKQSSSGGFFSALANRIIEEGGIVYGVIFSDDFRDVYYSNSDEISIDKMRGSKYVTAKKNNVYTDISNVVKNGRNVLFVGLPCEVAAIYSTLKKNYDNLLTCELICAGATSYNVLDEQLNLLENKYRSKTKEFSFRFKKYGWVPYSIYWKSKNGSQYSKIFDDTVFGVGMKFAKRDACYECVFKDINRVADFSIGDFWNVDKKTPYYNENGTSVIFVRTEKAKEYLNDLHLFKKYKVSAEDAQNGNYQQLKLKLKVPEMRNVYMKTLRESGGKEAFRQYRPKQSMKVQVKNKLPAWCYRLLRKMNSKL